MKQSPQLKMLFCGKCEASERRKQDLALSFLRASQHLLKAVEFFQKDRLT